MSILCSIHQLSLIYPEKNCFEQFDARIYSHQRIAVIGDNGCGKTSLLRMIAGLSPILDGDIRFSQEIRIGYVPQIPEGFDGLSGSERFQKALSEALSCHPELLILDEPTNHLDTDNRKQLLQFLQYYPGTLLVSSHDSQLLSMVPDCLWSIKTGEIEQFDGQYEDFLREKEIKYAKLSQQLACLEKDKRAVHHQLMKEQKRARSSKEMGKKSIENRKWPTIVSHAKMHRASQASGRKRKQISDMRDDVIEQMSALDRPEITEPKFHLPSGFISHKSLVMIKDGVIGYAEKMLTHQINFQLFGQNRLAITGSNGSGKSTLIKAIMNHKDVVREGDWLIPAQQDIGYLDQHYNQLSANETVLSSLEEIRPDWTHQQIRSHLNDFLFKSNSVVNQLVDSLSGGEKARLSLARIAACPPKLLILDEMTNNLDATTRNHVIQCLQQYPGPMIVISHDEDFLRKINIKEFYHLC
ncbi:ATP-binding cassette domain-containing protein [Legionella yabuuchiae]|uniref:ATP-binding cassette domain-containing protein n=1 Tax=Legionella yabuuchiae TaxID=376727 RepID=UPI00105494BF|nr:ATP-binding cassette domain-containing protein [Legionella yabuuchiae]